MIQRGDIKTDNLTQVIKLLAEHGPEELSRWFHDGVKLFEDGLPLERGLGITRFQVLKRKRNCFLKEAYKLISPKKCHSMRCELLESEIQRFKLFTWEKIKNGNSSPESLSEKQYCYFMALKTGIPMPKKKMISNIVLENNS